MIETLSCLIIMQDKLINAGYCIHLPTRNDRLQHIQTQVIEHSNTLRDILEIYPAVNGAELSLNDSRCNILHPLAYKELAGDVKARWGLGMTLGGFGLILTYINILSEIVEAGKSAIILEDDIDICEDFDDKFTNATYYIPDDADVVYIGWSGKEGKIYTVQKVNEYINLPIGKLYGTFGLILTPSGAEKILRFLSKNVRYQIDTLLISNYKSLNVYMTDERLIIHPKRNTGIGKSDIQIR